MDLLKAKAWPSHCPGDMASSFSKHEVNPKVKAIITAIIIRNVLIFYEIIT
jgi:hypothetical protein